MGFINYNVEALGTGLSRIGKRLLNGILAGIRLLCQQFIGAELLRIQEIDVSALKVFCVVVRINGDKLPHSDFIRFALDFKARLFIQFRHIGQPYDYSVRLAFKVGGAKENIFKQRSHDDCLT